MFDRKMSYRCSSCFRVFFFKCPLKMFLKTSLVSSKSSFNVRFSSSSILSSVSQNEHTKSPPKHISTLKHHSQLYNFLRVNCRSGNFSLDEAFDSFNYMIHMHPTPAMSSFSILFSALVKKKHFDQLLVMYTRFISAGLLPHFFILNILIDCLSKMARDSDGFVVFGSIFRRGFYPNVVTFTCLINGLCMEGKIKKAIEFFRKMVSVGCRPDVVTVGTLITGLCRTGNVTVALQLFEEMNNGRGYPAPK